MGFAPIAPDQGAHANPHGLICAANENRFTSGHYSEPLTAYTVGWNDPENIDAILARLFPEVMVGRRFEFKNATNAQAFLTETDDDRAIGATFKKVKYTGTSTLGKTNNRGLTVTIDHDEVDDVDAEAQTTISRLLQRLARNELARGIVLLEANDTAAPMIFAATTNPDGLIRTKLGASADISGIRPNIVLFGEAAWDLRLDAYEAPARVQPTNRADKTLAELAGYLMVDLVEVVKARFQSTATAKSRVVPSTVYAYSAFQGAGKDDPSAVKRFVSNSRGGQRYGVYRTEHEKYTDVSVEMYSSLVATGVGIVSGAVTAS